ncbi:MAG: outer membrane beta-barrel protein, partial [Nitrospira sp.]|nr:outer membrane beta-barrel protein [Nitrospira sp.]
LAIALIFGLSPKSEARGIFAASPHSLYINFGLARGGMALGADYEYAIAEAHGIGGFLRFYDDDDDRGSSGDGLMTFGMFIRPHFQKQNWDFYLSPGFGVQSIKATGSREDKTTMGPSLAIGLLYEIQSQISIGIENMRHYVWFEDDYRGLFLDDFMFKFRMRF